MMITGLPYLGWRQAGAYDVRCEDRNAPLDECDLCGTAIRYVHVYDHDTACPSRIGVGSECAGHIDGRPDLLDLDKDLRSRPAARERFVGGEEWPRSRSGGWRKRRAGWIYYIARGKFGGYRASYLPPGSDEWQSTEGWHRTVEEARAALYDSAHPYTVTIIDRPDWGRLRSDRAFAR